MNRYRHEYKYLLDSQTEHILQIRAAGILLPDPHVQADGTYYIRSLYFDDYQDSCMYENDSGTDPRAKFRIRYYNQDISHLRLEKKSKCRGMTQKETCSISEAECKIFMSGEVPELEPSMSAAKKRLFLEMKIRSLLPKVIVSYERTPFIYSGGNVRVTFDKKISSSSDLVRFLDGNYSVRPILPCGSSILEVKWDEIIPRHIKDCLQLNELQWTAFSKYYMCRQYHL